MSYSYEAERPKIFTEDGQEMFLKIRDAAKSLTEKAGAVRMQELLKVTSGDRWQMLACVDRLVELGELREIKQGPGIAGQDRIFVRA